MFPIPPAHSYVVSYPKTGRTWLRALIGAYLHVRRGLPEANLIGFRDWQACGFPATWFTHGQSGFALAIASRAVQPEGTAFAGRRVLLLVRDLRDTLVSAYFWATRRLGVFDGTLSAFIRDQTLGADKFLTYYRGWYDSRHAPREFLLARYEDLHRDPAASLASVLRFLGEPEVDRRAVDAAVEYASISNLRRIERDGKVLLTDRSPLEARQAWNGDDPEAAKFRRGVVGGYADYLAPDDLAFLAARQASLGCPFTA